MRGSLENAIERAVVPGMDAEIGVEDLPDQVLVAGRETGEELKTG